MVPDNVLFEGGAGERVRRKLLHECDVHTLLRLYSEGRGYRAIADLLILMHITTTKSSVERLIKGQPPYTRRRPSR